MYRRPWLVYLALLVLKVLPHAVNAWVVASDWRISFPEILRNEIVAVIISQWVSCLFVVYTVALVLNAGRECRPNARHNLVKAILPAIAVCAAIAAEVVIQWPWLLWNVANPVGKEAVKLLSPLGQ